MLRVGDLQRSIGFYTGVLGMQVLRTTDRPEQKYTLAFVGYGDESKHAVLELTYNYGVDRYDLGNAYGHIAIEVPDAAAACRLCASKGGTVTPRRRAGQGRHDRHRFRAGSRRLQDRADPALKRQASRYAGARSNSRMSWT